MRRTITVATLAALLAVAVTITVLWAQTWTDTQTTSGAVSVTTESADLYICEPTGAGSEPCPGDDSGEDETIFENVENLYPGAESTWVVRLRNVGSFPWDVTGATVTVTETQDPGADCADTPLVWMTALTNNDNHVTSLVHPGGTGTPKVGPPFSGEQQTAGSPDSLNIHAEAGGQDDMRVRVRMPSSLAVECKDNIWDIGVAWEVTPH